MPGKVSCREPSFSPSSEKIPWNGGFSLVFRPLAGTAFPLQETFSPAPQPACRGRLGIPRFCVLRRVLRVFSVFPVFLGLGRSGIVGEFPCPGAGVFSWSARFFSPRGLRVLPFLWLIFLWNPWCLRSFWRCPVGYGRVKFPAVILWRGSTCVSLGCGGCFTRAFPGMGMPPVSLGGWVFRRGPRRRLQLLG